jgi:hypothetical protein
MGNAVWGSRTVSLIFTAGVAVSWFCSELIVLIFYSIFKVLLIFGLGFFRRGSRTLRQVGSGKVD